jgi:hypothetical protein
LAAVIYTPPLFFILAFSLKLKLLLLRIKYLAASEGNAALSDLTSLSFLS